MFFPLHTASHSATPFIRKEQAENKLANAKLSRNRNWFTVVRIHSCMYPSLTKRSPDNAIHVTITSRSLALKQSQKGQERLLMVYIQQPKGSPPYRCTRTPVGSLLLSIIQTPKKVQNNCSVKYLLSTEVRFANANQVGCSVLLRLRNNIEEDSVVPVFQGIHLRC